MRLLQLALITCLASIVVSAKALAYIGPGAGMSAIGTFLGIVAAALIAFVGLIWYPLRLLLRRGKPGETKSDTTDRS